MSKEKEQLIKQEKYVEYGDDVCIAMDAEMFKDLFALMSALIQSEVQVQIKDDGLYVKQLEEARVGMTDMFVPKQYFKTLKAGQKIKEMRLPVQELQSVLTRLSHGDIVEFTVSDKGKLHIEVEGKRIRVFEIPLLEAEAIERRTPKVPFNVRIKTTMEGLLFGLEDAQKIVMKSSGGRKKEIYGQVMMKTTAMGLRVEATSEDELYSTGATLTSGWDIMKFEGSIDQRIAVAVAYIIAVIKTVSKITNVVQLEFSSDMPLHIIAELPFKGMTLEYWLAPRIEVKEATKRIKEEVKEK